MNEEHVEVTVAEEGQAEDLHTKASPPAKTRTEVVELIASHLGETDPGVQQLLRRVVKFVGIEQSLSYLQQTLEIEERGGLMTLDGSRRRSAGGVFFFLVKTNIPQNIRYTLFPGNPGTHPYQPQEKAANNLTDQSSAATPAAWADRADAVQEIGDQKGTATVVKIEVRGRPGKIVQRNTYVVTSMNATNMPSLPKGLPTPDNTRTTYTVYIANKQWKKVEESIKNEEDILILEGIPVLDLQTKSIAVFVTNANTRLLLSTRRQTQKQES